MVAAGKKGPIGPEETGVPLTQGRAEGGGTHPLAWYSLGVLIVAVVFGFVDRQILALVVEPIKHDLRINDLQIGVVQGLGPVLFAAIAGYPLAWLADRFDRRYLLIVCILFWSAATAARGLAGGFGSLLMLTSGIAVGEAVLTPVIYSLIPDMFSGKRRELANFVFFGVSVIGVGFGLMLAGLAVASVEALRPLLPIGMRQMPDWRLVFFLVALPGLVVSLLVLPIPSARRTISRNGASGPNRAMLWSYLSAHRGTVIPIVTAAGLYAFGFGALVAWLPVAIIRDFGAPAESVGLQLGFTFMAAACAGVLLAMATAPFWRRIAGKGHVVRAMWVSTVSAIPPLTILPWAASPLQAYGLVGIAYVVAFTGTAFSPTLIQDMAPPALRARFAAIFAIVYAILGASGPMVVGTLSTLLGDASTGLLSIVASLAVTSMAAAALLFRVSERPFVRTIDALQNA